MGTLYSIFVQYLEKGGIVNIVIAAVCLVALYIGFTKTFLFMSLDSSEKKSRKTRAGNSLPAGISCANIWLANLFIREYNTHPGRAVVYFKNWFRELLLEKVPQLEDGLDTMAAWIAVAPLLGLLGTVVGMVETFSIITRYGVGNPNLLSEGISVALITTQSGLVVAFPCLLFHNYLVGRKNALIHSIIADGEKLIQWIETGKK
jgi:biopolymer transport protein ExbB